MPRQYQTFLPFPISLGAKPFSLSSSCNFFNLGLVGSEMCIRDRLKTPFSLLWNEGPGLKKLDQELKKKDLSPNELGKGRNVWYCIGMSIARDTARSVALHDCDINTYDRRICLLYTSPSPRDLG